MPGQATSALNLQADKIFELYENGKDRRYKLLFAVNGGAYALIGFLIEKGKALERQPIAVWTFVCIPIALILYTWVMYFDTQCVRNEDARALQEPVSRVQFRDLYDDWQMASAVLLASIFCSRVGECRDLHYPSVDSCVLKLQHSSVTQVINVIVRPTYRESVSRQCLWRITDGGFRIGTAAMIWRASANIASMFSTFIAKAAGSSV